MKNLLYSVVGVVIVVVTWACGVQGRRADVVVSIEPLRWVAASLLDSASRVSVLVPAGSSPETYEPTARQVEQLADAKIYLSVGLLDFEQELASRLSSVAPQLSVVTLSDGVEVLEGSCSHVENHHHAGHQHGVDPHIWLSPKLMRGIVVRTAQVFVDEGIGAQNDIFRRRDSLLTVIDSVDRYIERKSEAGRKVFAIVHPSLSYFAMDYGLRFFALEVEGKEPNTATMTALVDTLRANNISTIFYSVQTPDIVAKAVAKEIGGELQMFDPLDARWSEAMISLSDKLWN